ncbi:hypothetical protein [Alteromonas gilva]|uniref:Uncharacterized protein n=1 Tax=Alteromonas gilva TaxID=2987522 RepID=A0ABT5L8T0_9ALTE|nr:hypothetical protein [Alteromonas gilva]MDC8832959.1 hypothetical protein [Alteromonas gilva]
MNSSSIDKHKHDPYIKILGNKTAVASFALAMGLIGIGISVFQSDWLWFSRFGSLITVSGLLLISSPIFVRGVYKANSSTSGFAELDHEGKVMVTSSEDRAIGSKVYQGVLITIVGTVIWGFGDLLNNVC